MKPDLFSCIFGLTLVVLILRFVVKWFIKWIVRVVIDEIKKK